MLQLHRQGADTLASFRAGSGNLFSIFQRILYARDGPFEEMSRGDAFLAFDDRVRSLNGLKECTSQAALACGFEAVDDYGWGTR